MALSLSLTESDHDVSEDETEKSEVGDGSLAFELGLWAAKFNIPAVAVSRLLSVKFSILYFPKIPEV